MKHPILAAIISLLISAQAMAASKPDSLTVRIGQMLMVGFRGMDATTERTLEKDIRERGIGGVVLFDYDVPSSTPVRNIESPEQVARLDAQLQSMATIPLFISIDQEGGRVNRLKPARGFPSSVSAAHLGKLDNPDSTRLAAGTMAGLLRSLKINMNLAPDVDLNTNPSNPVIGKLDRSFSKDPKVVVRHAGIFADAFRSAGIVPVLKHFPGHGSSTKDTHRDFTDVTSTWTKAELEPYRELIGKGYEDPVMTAHVFNEKLDSRYPATLSKAIVGGILRHDLGFRGVVVSDDLQMRAIADHYGLEQAIRLAIDAGVDILLFANNSTYDPHIAKKASKIIRKLVENGEVSRERIDESYRRIMALKQRTIYQWR